MLRETKYHKDMLAKVKLKRLKSNLFSAEQTHKNWLGVNPTEDLNRINLISDLKNEIEEIESKVEPENE